MHAFSKSTKIGAVLCTISSYTLLSWIASPDLDIQGRNPTEIASSLALGLPTPQQAQASHVHLKKSFLTKSEIQTLLEFAQEMKSTNQIGIVAKDGKGVASSSYQSTVWTTSYLHTDHKFEEQLPQLKEKIRQSLIDVDSKHFHILKETDKDEEINVRTIEFHEYIPGGNLKEKLHYDAGSCVTIDICLEDNYTGGNIIFPEIDGTTTVVSKSQFLPGDAAFFMSHKYHNVLPVESGNRKVLVAELWKGPKRACPHRCITTGECTYSLGRNQMERSREHLSILG